MTRFSGGKRKWIVAVLASLLLHSLFFFCLPVFEHKGRQSSEVIVRLVERNVRTVPVSQPVKEPAKRQPVKEAPPAVPAKTVPANTADAPANKNAAKSAPADLPAAVSSANAAAAASQAEPSSAAVSAHSAAAEIADASSLVITKKVVPVYPSFSRKRREEGSVTLIIAIENGAVVSCRVESSSGYARLDEAAKSAVSQWRFAQNGSIKARVPVSFKLSD